MRVTADLYCSRADVNKRLPLGSIVSPAGIVASVNATSNAITFDGHGLETDDAVTVRAIEDGTLPSPLVAGTTYYAIRLSNATFSLSATVSGSAINITTSGDEMSISREPNYDETIEFYSRWADGFLPAHLVPLTSTIHPLVRGVVADLAAKKILNVNGQDSSVINSAELAAKAMLERYAAGIPLRGADVSASSNLAIRNTLGTAADPRGWGSGSLP